MSKKPNDGRAIRSARSLPLKIAIVGAHGTGKSTLTKRLSASGAIPQSAVRIAMTPEVPRIVCSIVGDAEYFRRGNNSLVRQLMLLVGQPIFETARLADCDVLVCDRSLLDHWAYTVALFGGEIPTDTAEVLATFVREHMASYDLVFYVPIEFVVEDDGTREGDVGFQAQIDTTIRGLLDQWQVPYRVLSGAVEERFSKISQELGAILVG